MDYIYCVLYSPSYREKYGDLLKSEFPRIPYPNDQEEFWKFVELGKKLRETHLMIKKPIGIAHGFCGEGNNTVEKAYFADGAIFINKGQRFLNVQEKMWEAYISGYQPLQKWMKDRKGMTLSKDDITHYCLMIQAVEDTLKIMQEIDEIKTF